MDKLKILFTAVFTFLSIAGVEAHGVVISVPVGLSGAPGSTLRIPVYIDNQLPGQKIIGWQMDFHLPEAFTFVEDQNGMPNITLNRDFNPAGANILQSFPNNEDKTMARALSFNMYNAPMKVLSGEILNFKVILPSTPGEYTLTINNIRLSMDNFTEVKAPEVEYTLTVVPADTTDIDHYIDPQITTANDIRIAGNNLYNAGGQNLEVYTANGILIYKGNDSSVTLLTKGPYIVKSGDKVLKINGL